MNFALTEEHLMIRNAARDFAHNELLPGVIERDENQTFPKEQVKKLSELGFFGMMVDPKYGGSGMDTISYVLAMEEISKVDASTSVIMSVNNSLVCWGIETFGTEEQKEKYLTRLAKGEIIGSFCYLNPRQVLMQLLRKQQLLIKVIITYSMERKIGLLMEVPLLYT